MEQPRKKRIMLLLPHKMAARNILYSNVASYIKELKDIDVTIVAHEDFSDDGMRFDRICQPFMYRNKLLYLWSDCKLLILHILHMMVTYRFNSIQGFVGFKHRTRNVKKTLLPRWNQGHALSFWFGIPFPQSTLIYKILCLILYSRIFRHKFVAQQFDKHAPDKLFIVHLQIANIIPYIIDARARGIPIHGMIGSWDQPSTKGPIYSGIEKIGVYNRRLQTELEEWHKVNPSKVSILGWPQMDCYHDTAVSSRSTFLQSIGLSTTQKYILCGAYAEKLGHHESEIFHAIAQAIQAGNIDSSICLYIRAHPLDRDWERRFESLKRYGCVLIAPPSLNDLEHLSQLLRHASVVLASAGTILLDAIAHDCPTIALAYGSKELMAQDPHIVGRFNMEHISALMESGAIIKATNHRTLVEAIKDAINNPERSQKERAFVRQKWLEPFDGKAAKRLAEAIGL